MVNTDPWSKQDCAPGGSLGWEPGVVQDMSELFTGIQCTVYIVYIVYTVHSAQCTHSTMYLYVVYTLYSVNSI